MPRYGDVRPDLVTQASVRVLGLRFWKGFWQGDEHAETKGPNNIVAAFMLGAKAAAVSRKGERAKGNIYFII